MPKREHGHKQLGRAAAVRHLGQLAALFALGGAFLLLAPQAPGQGRVAMATFGVTYALQVGGLVGWEGSCGVSWAVVLASSCGHRWTCAPSVS